MHKIRSRPYPINGTPKEPAECEIDASLQYFADVDCEVEHLPRIICNDNKNLRQLQRGTHACTTKARIKNYRILSRCYQMPGVRQLHQPREQTELADQFAKWDRRFIAVSQTQKRLAQSPAEVLAEVFPILREIPPEMTKEEKEEWSEKRENDRQSFCCFRLWCYSV